MLVWSLIDTTIVTSIQVEKCNQFSCRSFKTDIFVMKNGGMFGDFFSLFDKIYHNFVMDNNVLILFLPLESELNSEGFIH